MLALLLQLSTTVTVLALPSMDPDNMLEKLAELEPGTPMTMIENPKLSLMYPSVAVSVNARPVMTTIRSLAMVLSSLSPGCWLLISVQILLNPLYSFRDCEPWFR